MKSPLLLAVAIFSSTGVAAQHTIDITSGDPVSPATSTAPDRTVENLENGVRVTYTFSYARFDSIPSDSGNGTFIVSFDGFGISEIPGHPALPSKLDAIEVPSAEQAVLTIETIDYSDYFFEIAPAMPPELDSTVSTPETTAAPISVPTGFFPVRQVEIVSSQSHYDKEICFLSLSPVAYDHDRKSVRIANKIVYTVSFGNDFAAVSGPKKARSANPDNSTVYDDPVYSNIVLNAPASSSTPNFGEITQDYLILTTSECENAVKKFADWKRALGFRTHVSVSNNFVTDAIVKDTIETYFNKYVNTLKYLLIVGNASDIAAFKRTHINPDDGNLISYVTDYYYQLIDSVDNVWLLPHIYSGRIPASTNSEAEAAFDKIMAYETCRQFSNDFFKKGVHCAFFQNDTSLVYDSRRFVRTSEEILNTAQEIGIEPQRIYTVRDLSKSRPKYYAKGYETYGEELPQELLSPDFNWINFPIDVKNALESGTPYLLYRGHGQITEWVTPQYTYDDILREKYNVPNLFLPAKNPIIYPVIFSITCLTGKYDTDAPKNFASTSILSKNKGSSCIIAASEIGLSGFNDALTLGMFDAFYPIPIKTTYISKRPESYKPVYRIGQILTHGLCKMQEKKGLANPETLYTSEIFHCFGDPSMMIWCQEPTKFENAKIDLDTNSLVCNVTTGGEPAYISFYDRNANNVKCYYGTEASFKFSQIHNGPTTTPYESVVISAPNKIPTIKSAWSNDTPVPAKIENLWLDSYSKVTRIVYTCGETDDIQFIVTSVATGKSRIIQQPKGESEAVIDLSDETSGIYVITMVVNGNKVDSSTISIN